MTNQGSGTYHGEVTRRLAELLNDGEWHPYDAVVREAAKLIPPGPAMRRTERDRVKARSGTGWRSPAERRQPRETSAMIASGARAIMGDILRNARNFEQENTEKVDGHSNPARRVRMIRTPVAATSKGGVDPLAERLRIERDTYREQVGALRAYLIEIGHVKAAQRLAPEG